MPDQPPISSYGLIGDLRTAALVGTCTVGWTGAASRGSIARASSRRFSTRSRRQLGDPARRSVHHATAATCQSTNILETTFRTEDGEVRVVDFMPVGFDCGSRRKPAPGASHRQVTCTGGEGPSANRLHGASSTTRPAKPGSKSCDMASSPPIAEKRSPRSPERRHSSGTSATGRAAWRCCPSRKARPTGWCCADDDDDVHPVDRYDSARKLEVTAAYWRVWASQIRYTGPYHTRPERSPASPSAPAQCYSLVASSSN